jgi:hypothetical protein
MFQRNQNIGQEEHSIMELKGTFDLIYQAALKEEPKNLIIIIDHLQKIMNKKISETPVHYQQKDENLSTAIYEKCLVLKSKNESLKVSALNLRATLSKIMSHSKQQSEK